MRLIALLFLLFSVNAHAAISFISASTDRSASDTSVTPSDPASAQEDDLYIGFAFHNSEDGTWSCPTSWTEVDNNISAVSGAHTLVCYIKRGGSAPNLTFSYSGTADDIRAVVYAFRGQDTTSPFDVTYSAGSHYQESTNDPTAANPAITTNTNDAVVVLFQALEFSAAGTPGAPSGYTLDSTGHGLTPQLEMAYKTVTSAGTETPGVWTHTSFNSGDDPLAYTLAIKPSTNAATLRRRR